MTVPVGSSQAGRILRLRPPPLRVRYRHGVYVDLRGYPDWLPYTAAQARLPEPAEDLTRDEARLVDVLVANLLLADALTAGTGMPVPDRTPLGWIWAHLGHVAPARGSTPLARELALVPAELHAAFRHRGGWSAPRSTVAERGLRAREPGGGARFRSVRLVSDEAVMKLEAWLGYRLPEGYRDFLRTTNGGLPLVPAVHADCGFLLDQPLFGFVTEDRMLDLAYANVWFGDRLTGDFLAIGLVQGGLLAVKVRGADAGSVWFLDDDDPRDDERYDPAVICRDLLVHCGPDVPTFLSTLSTVPRYLLDAAERVIASGEVLLHLPEGAGEALPRARRTDWVSLLAAVLRADR